MAKAERLLGSGPASVWKKGYEASSSDHWLLSVVNMLMSML